MRLILAHAGQDFDDVRWTSEEWPNHKNGNYSLMDIITLGIVTKRHYRMGLKFHS